MHTAPHAPPTAGTRNDLSQREVVLAAEQRWVPSPSPGVERVLLERWGGEDARATSLVRYAAGAHFAPHVHPEGEELLVLEGVLSDEHGDYPAGTYVRNPPGSRHAPFSREGCLLFVKVRHFAPGDEARVVIDTRAPDGWQAGSVEGLRVRALHAFGQEKTALVHWAPGTVFPLHLHAGGEEILVLEGVFADDAGEYPAGSWLRSPAGSAHRPEVPAGSLILVKTGHLPAPAHGG